METLISSAHNFVECTNVSCIYIYIGQVSPPPFTHTHIALKDTNQFRGQVIPPTQPPSLRHPQICRSSMPTHTTPRPTHTLIFDTLRYVGHVHPPTQPQVLDTHIYVGHLYPPTQALTHTTQSPRHPYICTCTRSSLPTHTSPNLHNPQRLVFWTPTNIKVKYSHPHIPVVLEIHF